MEECMFLLMVAILALSCLISCWVYEKLECKVLKQASKSWLRVWAMMMKEHEKGQVGPHKKWVMGEVYYNNQGNELNPVG
jgi:hypothetical protein